MQKPANGPAYTAGVDVNTFKPHSTRKNIWPFLQQAFPFPWVIIIHLPSIVFFH